jgi:GMP synthase-like glutamine amidotransferase
LLGCETNEPYGPIPHTGELFHALLEQAASSHQQMMKKKDPPTSTTTATTTTTTVFQIDLYNAKNEEYPGDWSIYHGVILPGSFSAAYDTDPWIIKLQSIIQTVLVAQQIPTLGICLGHQIFAHSFQNGLATRTPSGARGGRYTMTYNHMWRNEEEEEEETATSLDLYYTHGDMVAQLPETAICLGGDDTVPIQAAAYFGTIQERNDWLLKEEAAKPPFAVTFQAHPEYATSMDRGVERTLCQCLQAQADKGLISNKEQAMDDSIAAFERVKTDSLTAMARVLELLRWA